MTAQGDGDLVIGRVRSPEFVACLWMLRELDMLISSGQGDNPEADAIRNRMEVTWMALSEGESHLLDLVSVAIGHP